MGQKSTSKKQRRAKRREPTIRSLIECVTCSNRPSCWELPDQETSEDDMKQLCSQCKCRPDGACNLGNGPFCSNYTRKEGFNLIAGGISNGRQDKNSYHGEF